MLKIDLHSHTLHSLCGNHTILEMLSFARAKGIEGLAITDHGNALGKSVPSTFYERFKNPFDDITLFKGVECNLTKNKGEIDLPHKLLKNMDLVLLGIHPNTPKELGRDSYTELLIAAMENNPVVDFLTHLNDAKYPVHFFQVVKRAKEIGIAVELNNSKSDLGVAIHEETQELIKACMKHKCPVVINSDAHAVHELGQDSAIRPYLSEVNFPEELILNRNMESTLAFIEKRKAGKQPK